MSVVLFRLWFVLTAVWLVLMFSVAEDFWAHILNVMAPPLFILAIGAGLVWAARGYRRA